MEFSTSTLALIGIATFASAIVGGMGGFGTGIMLTAVLTPILGIKAVVPTLGVAGVVINAGRFWFYRHDFDRRVVTRVLPPALLLLALGTWLFQRMNPAWLSIIIGAIVIAAIPARRILHACGLSVGRTGLVVGGGVFGLLNGLASGMGVVLVSLLMGAGLSGTAVLATDALVTIVIDISRSLLFGGMNVMPAGGVLLGAAVGLVSLPGSWVASRLVKKLGARLHIAVIDGLISVGGISLIYHGGSAL